MVDGFVGYRVDFAIAEVKGLGLPVIEWAGTSAAKNGKLIAGFIDGAVTIDSFLDGQRGASRMRRGDQFRRWTRAEAREIRGIVPGRNKFEDTEAISAVGDKGKGARRDHSNLHVVHIVELASGTEKLIELGGVRFFQLDNR